MVDWMAGIPPCIAQIVPPGLGRSSPSGPGISRFGLDRFGLDRFSRRSSWLAARS